MDTALAAVIIAGSTLGYHMAVHIFGGGWKLTNRLTKIESSVDDLKTELKKLSDVLIKMADMRGELRVIDTRVTSVEQDIRELRHGRGFIQDSLRGEYP
jgi:hypothetical protein